MNQDLTTRHGRAGFPKASNSAVPTPSSPWSNPREACSGGRRTLSKQRCGTGSGAGLIFTPGSNTPTIDNPLDLENAVIFMGDNFAPAFMVEADDRPADASPSHPSNPSRPPRSTKSRLEQRITFRNRFISPLAGLAVRRRGAAALRFHAAKTAFVDRRRHHGFHGFVPSPRVRSDLEARSPW
jgi:hypothetical protein